uniref:WD_REPEATS_REGION domain-containing protein n=1 Tax=Haemonchus contortus TaxID=6289 RepID=A0A7I4YKI2_HAECO
MLATRQRPEAFAWSPSGVGFHGGVVAEYAHYFDPNATSSQARLDLITVADIFTKPFNAIIPSPQSVSCEYRFNELSWAPLTSESHPLGLIFGGTENGTVVFLDAQKLVNDSSLSVVSSRRDHQGHVLSVDYSSDYRWAMSAGSAQLLLWDLTNLATPFSPGTPNFAEQVKRVRWNRSMSNILASLTSQRGSLWDMRRPGGPILEFAEIGAGGDWADICWKPDDSSTLIMCSQLAVTPGVQKWDLRYPTMPVKEFHVHERGVTAIDWHRKDPRLVVSAGNDGFARVFNPDTGEVVGAVQLQQVLQNDKVRAITWSESRPDLLAIQYFQHPTEFRSIEGGAENTSVAHMDVTIVPAWVSAAPVGASFAKGGRMATHYREWDDAKQMWRYSVEVKKLPVDGALYQSAMELQNAQESNGYGSYCEDRAHGTDDRNLQVLWTFLAALSNKQGRREFVRILGFGETEQLTKESRESRTSVTSNEVTQLTNIMSSVNYSSPRQNGDEGHSESDGDSFSGEVFARQPDLDWNQLDANSWSMLDILIDDGDGEVLDQLLAQRDYAMAFLLARDNASLTHRVAERFIAEKLSAPQRLLSLIATESFEQLIDAFPREHWSRLLALILTRTDRAQLVGIMRKIAKKWVEGPDSVHAAFAAVLAQDVDLLLAANRCYSLEERIKQAIVLRSLTGAAVNEEFEKLLYGYCEKLIDGGVSDVAWKTLNSLKIKDERLLELRRDLFSICGGEERTMAKEPEKPRSEHIQAINRALRPSRPQQQNSMYSQSSATSASSPSAFSHSTQPYRQPFNSVQQPGMPPMPPTFSSQPYPTYGHSQPVPGPPPIPSYQQTPLPPTAYAPTPTPPVPGPPPVPGFQPSTTASVYGQPPVVPGFNPVQTPIPPPPVAPAPFSNMPSNNYNYATNRTQASYAPSPSNMPTQEYSSKSSTVSPTGRSSGDAKEFSTQGWNDPPPLTTRKPTPPAAPVFEVNWKPLEQPPISLPNGLPGVTSGAPVRPPSSASTHHQQEHRDIPQVTLSPEDQAIMDRFYQLINSILSVNRTPVALHKVEEAKSRLGCELAPRLSTGKLSFATRKLLWQCSEQSAHGDYRGAVATCGQMVRSGGDFVEVSAFLPALKSLLSLAQSTFAR